ncbi:MAG: type II toxin-antitoxin system mRNA interferase toxin, RelE/StbE family [Patescibacteria group bacterium]
MIQIGTTKHFDKQYKKLRVAVKQRFQERIEVFKVNPLDPELRNHAIKGKKYQGHRSIDITGDIRALYAEKDGEMIIFGFIGSHSQLYG